MAVHIQEYTDFNLEEILALYESVGWTNYTRHPSRLEAAFRNSLKILGAWENARLVGIARAVGDGCTIVYIQDILVLPEAQGRGIGKRLLCALHDAYPEVYQRVLLTDLKPKTLRFYEGCGYSQAEKLGCGAFMAVRP